jgi:hypothetical protein
MVGGFLWLSGGVVGWRYVVSVATVGDGGVRGWLVGVLGGGLGVGGGVWVLVLLGGYPLDRPQHTQNPNKKHNTLSSSRRGKGIGIGSGSGSGNGSGRGRRRGRGSGRGRGRWRG